MKMFRSRAARELARDQRGTELLEFAISASVLFMMIFGIIDGCRALYAYHFVAYAAQEATRYAQVRGADWTSSCSSSAPPSFTLTYGCEAAATDVQNFVQSLASPGIKASSITVNTTSSYMWPATTPDCSTTPCTACSTNSNGPGCYVRVKVSYPFTFLLPYFARTTMTMTATSQKVIQY